MDPPPETTEGTFSGGRVEVVGEDDVPGPWRRSAAALLAAEWGEDWWPRGYAGDFPPEFRVVAVADGGALVGQVAVFRVPTAPRRLLFGIGDLVTDPAARARGIARVTCRAAVAECRARGAATILVDTVAAHRVFTGLGFSPVTGFAYFYERDGACRRHAHWLEWNATPPSRPLELLANGDF